MTKKQLFKKYSINESHSAWDNQIDNWMSVEVYRLMHDGNLPPKDDLSVKWVTQFLDKVKNDRGYAIKLMREREDFGSLFLTSKRMVYDFAEQLIK